MVTYPHLVPQEGWNFKNWKLHKQEFKILKLYYLKIRVKKITEWYFKLNIVYKKKKMYVFNLLRVKVRVF